MGFDVQLENANGCRELLVTNQLVAQRVEFVFIEVVGCGCGRLQVMVLLNSLVNAAGRDRGREGESTGFARIVGGFDFRQPHTHSDRKNSGGQRERENKKTSGHREPAWRAAPLFCMQVELKNSKWH